MPGVLPDGDPAPSDGLLPESVAEGGSSRDWGIYVHVPFCTVRCGYCDFNTYTAQDLPGVGRDDYTDLALTELDLAQRVMGQVGLGDRPVATLFFGGGTPTLLPTDHLARMVDAIGDRFGYTRSPEITVEANPDTVTEASLQTLAKAGVTRVSLGMQSAHPDILRVLDRSHDPESLPRVVSWVKAAGMQVSVDVIYGSPGETLSMWEETLDAVLGLQPDHISAYALIVEQGTALAKNIQRGVLPPIDEDVQAGMYERSDEVFHSAGYHWYEVSNWAKSTDARSRHNLAYWTSQDWWGIGPGAHSHVGGVRWWNVKHPRAYAERLKQNLSPALAREVLDDHTRTQEDIMLRLRTIEGLPTTHLPPGSQPEVAKAIAGGLIDPHEVFGGRIVPTLKGRLMADHLARVLTP